MPPILDIMGYTAKTLSGADPVVPKSSALGLVPCVYMGDIYLPGDKVNNPRVDAASVIRQCHCPALPWGAEIMVDTELLVSKMKINGPQGFLPNPDRLPYQLEFVTLVNAIRSTPKGAACKLMFYHSTMGSVHADNGTVWFNGWRAANDCLIEAVPGAPNGVGNLFDRAVGRCYRDYQDATLDARNIAVIGNELKRLYPNKIHVGLLQPRKSGGNWGTTAERFNYLSEEQFSTSLEAAKANFEWLGLWNSGHYGPLDWPHRNNLWYAVKTPGSNIVVGDEWNEDYGWWKAVKRIRGPIVTNTTIPAPTGGFNLGGGGVR